MRNETFNDLMNLPEVQIWQNLMNLYKEIVQSLEANLQKNDMTIPRFQILLILYFFGEKRSIDLTKQLNVSKPNMSTFVKRLTADDLIVIDDKKWIKISANGKKIFEQVFPLHIDEVKKEISSRHQKFLKISDILKK